VCIALKDECSGNRHFQGLVVFHFADASWPYRQCVLLVRMIFLVLMLIDRTVEDCLSCGPCSTASVCSWSFRLGAGSVDLCRCSGRGYNLCCRIQIVVRLDRSNEVFGLGSRCIVVVQILIEVCNWGCKVGGNSGGHLGDMVLEFDSCSCPGCCRVLAYSFAEGDTLVVGVETASVEG